MTEKREKSIVVIGSINTDLVVRTPRFPLPGETLIGENFFMNGGGKGANQAVAAARLGGEVYFVGKTGDDMYGKAAEDLLKKEGINIDHVTKVADQPSGTAIIMVDGKGENSIVVVPGANGHLSIKDIEKARHVIEVAEVVILQLEIPMETVVYAVRFASSRGAKVILNPAPSAYLSDGLLKDLYVITPNETEAGYLTGIRVSNELTAKKAAVKLIEKGVKGVIITMGAAGAFVMSDDFEGMVSAPQVKAVDTTAAGDTFNGALAVALTENMSLYEAVSFAVKAAAISVTRPGAQASVPYRNEIKSNK